MGTIFVDNIKEHTASHGVHIPGHICQVKTWTVAEQIRNTAGSWAANTAPTLPNTYAVETYHFIKTYSNSKVVFQASGNIDHANIGGGSPSIVCLFSDDTLDNGGNATNGLIGAAYRHMRLNGDEPYGYNFSGEDTSSGINKYYKLRCHSSADSMRISRMNTAGIGNSPYKVLFWEVMQ